MKKISYLLLSAFCFLNWLSMVAILLIVVHNAVLPWPTFVLNLLLVALMTCGTIYVFRKYLELRKASAVSQRVG